jgi:hypothetical protein
MPSLSDYGSALTGSGGRDAAKDAAAAQVAAAAQGMEAIEAGKTESLGYLDPYAKAGQGGLDLFVDYLGGREFTADPYAQQQIDRGIETVNRNAAGMGLGGGARAKRLMNESMLGANQFRQQEMQNAFGLGQIGSNTAGNQANIATGAAGNIAGLYGTQGDAKAAGIIGAQNAIGQGLGNMIQLGTMAAGGASGNPAMMMGGAQGLGGGVGGTAQSNPSTWEYQSSLGQPSQGGFSLGDF